MSKRPTKTPTFTGTTDRRISLWPTGFLIPPLTRGDGEFQGHGPRITISTRLYISGGNKIKARIHMRFQETVADWTTAQGTFDIDVFDGTMMNIKKIVQIRAPEKTSYMTKVQASGHGMFTVPTTSGPVGQYEIIGDTKGSEAGTRSGARLHFRDLLIECEMENERDEGVIEVMPETAEYTPPHVRGDRDFKGHGPRIFSEVNIEVRDDREIWADVYMSARETRSDWTTAKGSNSFRIYRHDKPIKEILSETSSDVYFIDNDHAEDVIERSAGELVNQFVFVGDTKGNEAGTETGVMIVFNPILIRT